MSTVAAREAVDLAPDKPFGGVGDRLNRLRASSTEEKKAVVETVSQYAMDGWAIAAGLHTPIGHVAALTAETACVPFVGLDRMSALRGQVGPAPVPVPGAEVN